MGQFSWMYADTNNRIALKLLGSAYVPCPDGTVIYESCYQCDGIFGGHDIYDLVTDWNRSYLSVGILEKPKRDDYTSSSQGERYYSNNLTRINRKSLFYIFPLCVTLKKKGVFHYVTYG